MRLAPVLAATTFALGLAACGEEERTIDGALPSFEQTPDKPAGPRPAPPAGTRRSFGIEEIAKGLEVPVQLITRPGDDRLFVVEQRGTIRVVEDGKVLPTPYLDLTGRVRSGGELGLLTAVFSPDGTQLTTMWTDEALDTQVVRYSASQVRAERDASERLLTVDQPEDYDNHKGGTLLHDDEGRLLLGLGDGGSAFDPGDRAQDVGSRLGKVLRYDGRGWAPVARGLRNPYRMSLDPKTGRLWIGDVGQDRIEEVDAILPPAPGEVPLNLGWGAFEGSQPVGRKPLTGPQAELVWPLAEYRHGQGAGRGCSVTGGVVHRGKGLPKLRGRYVFADFCTGELWSADARGAEDPARTDLRTERAGPLPQITSFAVAPDGGVVLSTADGRLHELKSD
jgi:glucose/arabinose dehydrogenase